MTESRYRKLLWIHVTLFLAAIVATAFPDYSDSLASAYANEPQAWPMGSPWVFGGIAAVLLATWLTGLVGLFFFKDWARRLSLYSTLAGFLVSPFFGASLSSGMESALFEASSVTWGAVLALSYFSPVSDRFGR